MGRIKSKPTPTNEAMAAQNAQVQISQQEDERIVYLTGEINEASVTNTIAQLFAFAKRNSYKPIYLVVSTYGGSIDEMFSLYDAIKFIKSPIYTVGLGKIMSAGVLLLAAGEKKHRLIGKNARIMIHSSWGGALGNVFEAENEMKEWKRQQSRMEQLLAIEIGKSHDEISKIMEEKIDRYLDSSEAIDFGIVDGYLNDNKL